MQDEIIQGQIEMDLGELMKPQPLVPKEQDKLPEHIRIRKLTPRECFRLMSFSDEDFDKAQAVNSNTQLYRQAGNSIVVAVLEAIFGQMFVGKEDYWQRWTEEKCYEDNHQ